MYKVVDMNSVNEVTTVNLGKRMGFQTIIFNLRKLKYEQNQLITNVDYYSEK
jgi:hypothetical protein